MPPRRTMTMPGRSRRGSSESGSSATKGADLSMVRGGNLGVRNVRPVLGGMLLIAATALLNACGKGDAKPDNGQPKLEAGRIVFPQGSAQTSTIVVDTVKAGEPLQLSLPGRLVWDEGRTVRLFPAFGGRVIRILAKVGDPVTQGQALAILASPDFGQAQADARRAQSDFSLAQKNLDRLHQLFDAGVAPKKDLSAAEADYARAQSELRRAEARVKLYGATGDSVDQNLALRSPIAGVVVERNINPGQELRPARSGCAACSTTATGSSRARCSSPPKRKVRRARPSKPPQRPFSCRATSTTSMSKRRPAATPVWR